MITNERYEQVWNVTGMHVVYLMKALAWQQMARDKRSAVLITSSKAADFVFAGAQTYSATKAMVSNFGESISYELKENVDVTVWEPGEIKTAIHLKDRGGITQKTAQDSVKDILTLLGKERNTAGSLIWSLSPTPPTWFIAPLLEKAMRSEYDDYIKLQAEKDAQV